MMAMMRVRTKSRRRSRRRRSPCRAKAMTAMQRFDRVLASRRYLAGERFSVADITGLIAIDFTKPARIAIPEELINLRRWREEVSARPSAKA